jgi:hypothetical protein
MSEYSFDNHDPLRIFRRIYHLGHKITLFAITKVIFQSDLVNQRVPALPGSLGPFVGCEVVNVEPDIDDGPTVAYTRPDFSVFSWKYPWTWPENR